MWAGGNSSKLPSFVKIVIIDIEANEQATLTVGLDIAILVYPINPNPPAQNTIRTMACPNWINFNRSNNSETPMLFIVQHS